MRILFVNRFFHPDHSATSQLASDLAFELAARGMEIVAITSRQRFDDARAALPRSGERSGVRILRVRTPAFGRARLAGRALDYLGFYLGAAWRTLREVRRGDVVVAMTDPPLLGVALWPATVLRGARLVHWLQDLFPEVAQRLGVRAVAPLAGGLRALRNLSLRHSDRIVVIGEQMAQFVEHQSGRRPQIIPNWALEEDTESSARPAARLEHPLRHEWGLGDSLIVGYSGNMGRAHRLAALVEAATLLKDDPGIVFLLIGDGAQRTTLEESVRERDLSNVRFQPYQPRSLLRLTLTLPDIHVVSLDERLEGLIVPSKFVGAIALGKPVLWLGAPDGELGHLVRERDAGVAIEGSDAVSLAQAIRAVAADPDRLERMGRSATRLWGESYRRTTALDLWQRLLAGIIER